MSPLQTLSLPLVKFSVSWSPQDVLPVELQQRQFFLCMHHSLISFIQNQLKWFPNPTQMTTF